MPDVFQEHVTPGQTPQSEQARDDQVRNNAGGYVFKVGDRTRLNRFLTIGTEGGTYYAREKPLTRDNAKAVMRLAQSSRAELIDDTVEVSEAGRAPRNNAALFAIAAAAGTMDADVDYRARALHNLPRVARTGGHLLAWAPYIELFRGWGPQLVTGVRNWYLSKPVDELAYQLLKYKQRKGWSHADILRLVGFKGVRGTVPPEHEALFRHIMNGSMAGDLPALVEAHAKVHETREVRKWVRAIGLNKSLSWEMLPTEALAEAEVWEALIAGGNLPLGALLTNLSRLTRLGVIGPLSPFNQVILGKLTDPEYVVKARIHPVAVLIAMQTYALGRSLDGKTTWAPASQVLDALNVMFYNAFGSVKPSGKRTVIAIDMSASMTWLPTDPSTRKPIYPFQPRAIAGAMAMVTAKFESQYAIMGFSHQFMPLEISPGQRLDDVIRTLGSKSAGGTDCSLPMIWATQNKLAVDVFQVWTDNETWYGQLHPHEALRNYRRTSGIEDAALQVIAVTPTEFSIADPLDSRQLDVSGFDSGIPNLLASHARGDL